MPQPAAAAHRFLSKLPQRRLHRRALADDDHARSKRAHAPQRLPEHYDRLVSQRLKVHDLFVEKRGALALVLLLQRLRDPRGWLRPDRFCDQRLLEIADADPVLVLDDLREDLNRVLNLRAEAFLPWRQLAVDVASHDFPEPRLELGDLVRVRVRPRRGRRDRGLAVERRFHRPSHLRPRGRHRDRGRRRSSAAADRGGFLRRLLRRRRLRGSQSLPEFPAAAGFFLDRARERVRGSDYVLHLRDLNLHVPLHVHLRVFRRGKLSPQVALRVRHLPHRRRHAHERTAE
eukprot:30819-Pelagococcus_subviridis.AAC.9